MVWGRNVWEIFGKSLHRTDRLVYRLLTLNFVSFLTKISTDNCLQLLTAMVAYTDGIRMLRFWNFCIASPRILFAFLYAHKLIQLRIHAVLIG